MALFTESEARGRARAVITIQKSASAVLTEHVRTQRSAAGHDIFLSHAFTDRELVLGAALMIEDLRYSVYIDWREDPYLDRSKVSQDIAAKLRERMQASRCLFYSTTSNASDSKWMPWELGFKDGDNTRVAVLPLVQYATTSYQGQEYLGIYPYIDVSNDDAGKRRLWVQRSPTCYVNFDSWLQGSEPTERG